MCFVDSSPSTASAHCAIPGAQAGASSSTLALPSATNCPRSASAVLATPPPPPLTWISTDRSARAEWNARTASRAAEGCERRRSAEDSDRERREEEDGEEEEERAAAADSRDWRPPNGADASEEGGEDMVLYLHLEHANLSHKHQQDTEAQAGLVRQPLLLSLSSPPGTISATSIDALFLF